jgi:hypothetical protein
MTLLLLLFALCFSCALAEIKTHDKLINTEDRVEGSYIVVYNDGVSDLSSISGFDDNYVIHKYDAVLNGVALRGVPDSVMANILNSASVKAVYEDGFVYAIPVEENDEATQILTEPWGLDR